MENKIEVEHRTESHREGKQDGSIKCRIDLDKKIYERYLDVKRTLKQRQATPLGISEFVNELLSKVPQSLDSQIVDQRTPLEFRIKSLLENDSHRKKLERLISKL